MTQAAPRLIHIDAYDWKEGTSLQWTWLPIIAGRLGLVEWAQFIETELLTADLDLALSYGQERPGS